MGDVTKTIGSVAEGAFDAVGSAIGTAAEGISSFTATAVSGISEVPSLFEGSIQQIGDFTNVIGGTIGDVAGILDPQDFFDSTVSGIGTLAGDLLAGPLTDLGNAISDPLLDFGGAVAGFADNIFGGGLVDSIENVISDIPLIKLPFQLLTNTFETNILSMNSILDNLFKLDPVAPDYQTQFSGFRVKLGRLELSDRVINKVMIRMHELTERITGTSLIDTDKEAIDRIEDERRRRFKERFDT
jgi:hypothetical protein